MLVSLMELTRARNLWLKLALLLRLLHATYVTSFKATRDLSLRAVSPGLPPPGRWPGQQIPGTFERPCHVIGVPLRPIRITLAELFLVNSVRGGGTLKRQQKNVFHVAGKKLACGPARKPFFDLLHQPRFAVRIGERGQGAIVAGLRSPAGNSSLCPLWKTSDTSMPLRRRSARASSISKKTRYVYCSDAGAAEVKLLVILFLVPCH